jgi:acyl carrier protein
MRQITADDVRQFLTERYAPALSSVGMSLDSFADDYDLLERGIIDSIGILEMVGAVEAEFQIELDLEHLDAELLTRIGPFCRYIESCAARSGQESAPHQDNRPSCDGSVLRSAQ